ncbi:MAG: outer membrane beta-barrel protein [Candidatus Kapabacteria bacterium]|nr:outer membrane beta-barrel protein [Candidatus Kapabacteria bacterium]
MLISAGNFSVRRLITIERTLVTLVTLVSLSSNVFAQEDVLRPYDKKKTTRQDSVRVDISPSKTSRFQSMVRVGVEGGINANFASRTVTGTLSTSPLMVLESGSGVSPVFGIYAEVQPWQSIALCVRVLYDAKKFGAEKTDVIEDCPIIEPISGSVIGYRLASLNSTYTTSVSYVTISPALRWTPFDHFFVQAGPVVQLAVGSISSTITETMDPSELCQFYTRGVASKEISTTTTEDPVPSTRFGVDVGIGYAFSIASWIELVPRIGYQWMFTPYTNAGTGLDDSSQYSNGLTTFTTSEGSLRSLQATLSLWFVLLLRLYTSLFVRERSMKIRFMMLLISIVGVTTTWAQEDVLRPKGRPGSVVTSSPKSSSKGLTWRLGLEAGINYSMTSRDITGSSSTSIFQTFASGSGVSPLFGVYVEVALSKSISLGGRFLYDMKSVHGSKSDVIRDCSVDDGSGGFTTVPATINADYTNKISYITINPLLRFSITDGLFAHIGPVVQVAASNIESTLNQSVDPNETCRFIDAAGQYTLTSTSSTTTATASPTTRFGLDVGLGYMIPLSSTIHLVPRVGYQYMFTEYDAGVKVTDNTQAVTNPPERTVEISKGSLNSLQASLSLWFTL